MTEQVNVPWHLTSEQDRMLAELAADRSVAMGIHNDVETAEMDILAFHMLQPLDLEKLLDFESHHFAHDVGGIKANLDRVRFRIDNFFLPRCHA